MDFGTEDKTGSGRKHREEHQGNQARERDRADRACPHAGFERDFDYKGMPCED